MWQEPKTDWKASDYFNIEDYNRIKNNLNEIRSQALLLWPDFEFEGMGDDKTYSDYGFYADEINKFESNIAHICAGTYPFEVGSRQMFYENQAFIGWEELNRLESACLFIYNNLLGQHEGAPRLGFKLGQKGRVG